MAQWIPKPDMYGQGGGEFIDDTGQVWPDPWGTLNTQAQAPVPGVNAGAPTSAGGGGAPPGVEEFLALQGNQPEPAPAPHEAPGAPGPALGTPEGLGAAMDAPMPTPGFANQQAAAGGPQAPTPTPGFADTKESTSSGKSEEKGSSGLGDEAQARQGANISRVAETQGAARDAAVVQGNLAADQAAARSELVMADAAQGLEKTAAQIALNDHIQGQVDSKMKAGAEWRPDRTELFHGDRGVAFGITAAIAAMAGAWMQGRGLTGTNPYLPTILKFIDDNANDQVRRNSTTMQFLREQKGDLKAAAIDLKQRQLRYATQRLDGLALKDSSELLRTGVEKTRAEMLAQDAKWEQEKRQALERTETNKITKSFSQTKSPQTGPLGGERTTDQAKTQAVFDAANKAYTSAGLVRGPDGRWRVGPGAFPPAALEKLNPFSDNEIQANMQAIVEAYSRLQSGGVIGEDERPAFEDQIGMNTLTRGQLAARANAAENMLRARLKSTDAAAQREATTAPEGWKK